MAEYTLYKVRYLDENEYKTKTEKKDRFCDLSKSWNNYLVSFVQEYPNGKQRIKIFSNDSLALGYRMQSNEPIIKNWIEEKLKGYLSFDCITAWKIEQFLVTSKDETECVISPVS